MSKCNDEKREIRREIYEITRQSVELTAAEYAMLINACVEKVAFYKKMAEVKKDGAERYLKFAGKYEILMTRLGVAEMSLDAKVDDTANVMYARLLAQRKASKRAK